MQRIEVIKEHGRLERQVWTFWFNEYKGKLILDMYSKENKKSTRHKWRSVKSYMRLDKRKSTILVSDVPLSDEVKQEALDNFMNSITVERLNK